MTLRKPLVVVTGRTKEVPAGDVLDPVALAASPDATKVLRGDSTWEAQVHPGDLIALASSYG